MNSRINSIHTMTTAANRSHCYGVEVSGWDANGNFFVQKTYGETHGKPFQG